MKLSLFDYYLPPSFIADYPAKIRDHSRLLVLDRNKGEFSDKKFSDILSYFRKGDVLVLNNSKVFPARLFGQKETGGRVEILLDREVEEGIFEAIGKGLKPGMKILFPGSNLEAKVLKRKEEIATINFNLSGSALFSELFKIGRVPLPPYIEKKRTNENSTVKFDDVKRYQTVYAKQYGSSAAPTAGLHFTSSLLSKLKKRGVTVLELTLHVGLGTFAPIKKEQIEDHKIHMEYFSLESTTLSEIISAKAEKRRIIAVGTTTTRVLEHLFSNLKKYEKIIPIISGWTEIYIYPPYKFKCIDGLITNFHLPKSSLLLLVSAFAGRKEILKAYGHAISSNYRFYSYGDAMLIL